MAGIDIHVASIALPLAKEQSFRPAPPCRDYPYTEGSAPCMMYAIQTDVPPPELTGYRILTARRRDSPPLICGIIQVIMPPTSCPGGKPQAPYGVLAGTGGVACVPGDAAV